MYVLIGVAHTFNLTKNFNTPIYIYILLAFRFERWQKRKENIMKYTIIDTFEEPIEIGSEIRIKYGKYRNRKAILIDIDYLSYYGSYRDRHTVQMVKSQEEFDCIREDYERW